MILCNEPLWSFESVRSINTQDRFTHFDYVRVLRQSGKLDQGSLLLWLGSYAPQIVEHNGRIYFAEMFSAGELEALRGRVANDADAQLLLNLVNITDVLGEDSGASIPALVERMVANLNALIRAQYPGLQDRAKVVVDEGDHYICIVRD